MVDTILNWEELERRVERQCDLSRVRDRDTFRQAVATQFFQCRHPETKEWVNYRPTSSQMEFVDELWDRFGDDVIRDRRDIDIQIKQFPQETSRFAKAIKLYPNILKDFIRGGKRSDIARNTAQAHGKSWRTIDRDIYSMVKIGVLAKTKKRGFYKVVSNLYV